MIGEMAERSKAAVLKTVESFGLRGFESLSLRQINHELCRGQNLIKVLLVDDHELVRIGIKRLLQDVQGIKVVGEAAQVKKLFY